MDANSIVVSIAGLVSGIIIAVGPLALGVTKAVDTVRNALDKQDAAPGWVWNVLAFSLGIGACLLFTFNLAAAAAASVPALAGNADKLDGAWGQLLTGLMVGGTSSFWHEHMDATSAKAKSYSAR